MTKPIHIHSTNGYWEVFVNLELLPKGLFMHYSWGQELGSLLKSLLAQKPKQKKLLLGFFEDTQVSKSSKKRLCLKMLDGVISSGLMAERLPFRVRLRGVEDIWQCLVICKMEKPT